MSGRSLGCKRNLNQYLVPNSGADSDIEVEDDSLEDVLDDDFLDPDFTIDLDEDNLTPTVSGKQCHQCYCSHEKSECPYI